MVDLPCTSYIFFNLSLEHCRCVLHASSQQGWLYPWRRKAKRTLCSPVLWTVRTAGTWMAAASAPWKALVRFVFLPALQDIIRAVCSGWISRIALSKLFSVPLFVLCKSWWWLLYGRYIWWTSLAFFSIPCSFIYICHHKNSALRGFSFTSCMLEAVAASKRRKLWVQEERLTFSMFGGLFALCRGHWSHVCGSWQVWQSLRVILHTVHSTSDPSITGLLLNQLFWNQSHFWIQVSFLTPVFLP